MRERAWEGARKRGALTGCAPGETLSGGSALTCGLGTVPVIPFNLDSCPSAYIREGPQFSVGDTLTLPESDPRAGPGPTVQGPPTVQGGRRRAAAPAVTSAGPASVVRGRGSSSTEPSAPEARGRAHRQQE
ncbi:hypothetical protein GCM10028793_02950 [Nocardiopsis oceani]